MNTQQRIPAPRRPITDSGCSRSSATVRFLSATCALSVLLSCSVTDDYVPPSMSLPGGFAQGAGAPQVFQAEPWWEAFRDPRLNALIEAGMEQNLTVRQAMERVTGAQATADVAGRTGTSSASIASNYNGDDDGNEAIIRNGQFNISWVIDFFGQYKRTSESADARLDEAYANVEVARLIYLSELASAYIDARFYQESLALKRKDLESRQQTLDLTQRLFEAQAITKLGVTQAEGLVNETISQMPVLENGFTLNVNRIATLIGRPSAQVMAEMKKGAAQPVPHRKTSVGIPADLVRNRADIRSGERRLAAASAEVGIAQAQLYPSVSLTGSLSSNDNGVFGTTGWGFGPVFDIPLFDMGQREAQVSVAESVARSRYLEWQELVLNAVEEVENAMSSMQTNARAAAATRKVVESYEQALDLSRTSYESGDATLLDVLSAQRSLDEARSNWANNIRQQAQDFVALNVALGGGQYAPVATAGAPVAAAAPAVAAAAVTASTLPVSGTVRPASNWVVAEGETLYRIAVNNGLSVEQLASANGIGAPYTVRVGQTLVIPARPPA